LVNFSSLLVTSRYGGRDWTNNLNWPGKDGFNKAQTKDWNVDGKYAGISQSYQGLTFLAVAEAGHMVPMDQPRNSLDMLKRFLTGIPW
jgi:cathepsin A (carboxypeptidase C)